MRHDEISRELRDLAFDFFYWFSRFEFALKEAPYLEDDKVGARAMPGWEKFFAGGMTDTRWHPQARS